MSNAVIKGTLQYVSPSQINSFRDCARKWFFEKVVGLKPPETTAQGLGTAIHTELERYFLHDTRPTHASVLDALTLNEVPKRDSGLFIEEPRNYELGITAAGIRVRGRIDLQIPPTANDPTFTIVDWKSTSNWRWCKTPEDLARNPQGIVYLKYGFQKWPFATAGVFQHVYLRTRGGFGARAVKTDPLSAEHVDDVYAGLESVVEEMKTAAAKSDASEVPATLASCDKYGGCPYRSVCPSAGGRPLDALINDYFDSNPTESTMSLAEKLAARRTAQKTAEEAATPAPKFVGATGINPPDAPLPDPVTPWNPPTEDLRQPQPSSVSSDSIAPGTDVSLKSMLSAPDVASAQRISEIKNPPKTFAEIKSGLRSGAAIALENAGNGEVSSPATVMDAIVSAYEDGKRHAASALTLFIDCEPVKWSGPVTRLADVIRERTPGLLVELRKQKDLGIPADATDLGQVKYGAGFSALRDNLTKNPPTGAVVASSSGSLSSAALEVLESQPGVLIVRG